MKDEDSEGDLSWSAVDINKTRSALKIVLFVASTVCIVCWALSFLIEPKVENEKQINPFLTVISFGIAFSAIVFFADKLTAVLTGILVGGGAANVIERLVSPINDYIPIAWRPGYYANLADLLVFFAMLLLIIHLANLILESSAILTR